MSQKRVLWIQPFIGPLGASARLFRKGESMSSHLIMMNNNKNEKKMKKKKNKKIKKHKKLKKKAKGLSSLPGGGQVDGLSPALIGTIQKNRRVF